MKSRVQSKGSRNWIYAAGDAPLVTEVEEYTTRPTKFGTTPYDIVTLDADGLVWTDLQRTLTAGMLMASQRLTVIRRAEKADTSLWEDLGRWRRTTDQSLVLQRPVLATSYERVRLTQDDARYLTFLKNKHTQHIDCHVRPERQVDYARLKLYGTGSVLPGVDVEVVRRCGGNLARLKSECEKLLLFTPGRIPTMEDVDRLVTPSPGELFVEALVAGRRSEAASRAALVGSLPLALGSLEWHVYNLFLIRKLKADLTTGRRGRVPLKPIADRLGLAVFMVQRLEGHAREYDLQTTTRRLHVLAETQLRMIRGENSSSRLLLPLVAAW